jgi:anthranilate phosphoribosyltransferase
VHGGSATETVFDPRSLGLRPSTLSDLQGGDPAFNAKALHALVQGAVGPLRDVVLLNAAAAVAAVSLGTAPLLDLLAGALERCRRAVDTGEAARVLAAWTSRARTTRLHSC